MFLSSCVKEKSYPNGEDPTKCLKQCHDVGIVPDYYDYSTDELDSVILKAYKSDGPLVESNLYSTKLYLREGLYRQMKDSSTIIAMAADYNYRIIIVSTQDTFNITDIDFEQREEVVGCNYGHCRNTFNGLKLNDKDATVAQEEYQINVRLSKPQ